MIDVGHDYFIDTYTGGYVVGKKGVVTDKKTGSQREVIQQPHYFNSISGALQDVFNTLVRDKLASRRKDIPLETAINDIKSVYKEFNKVIEPLKRLEGMSIDE